MTAALLLTSLLLVSAQASPKARSAAGKLSAAQAEFNRGDLRDALRLLDSAAQDTRADDDTLARVHLLRGQIFGAQQSVDRTEEAFHQALEHDPTLTLDPARVDPSLVRLLDALRDRMRGELNVTTERPGAQVRVDGQRVGVTPFSGKVPIGRRTVEVRDGAKVASEKVVVSVRQPASLTPRLVEPPQPAATVPSEIARLRPFADLRLGADLLWPAGTGFELGAGVESQYLRASAHFKLLQEFGLTFRGALSVPVMKQWRVFAEAELPLLFPGAFAIGLGGSGGAEFAPIPWVGIFAEVGGRHFFSGLGAPRLNQDQLYFQLGTRLRAPGLTF